MSAAGAIKDMVETVIKTITDALHAKDTEQDEKLAGLDKRLTALEDQVGVPEEKVTPVKKTTGVRAAGAKTSAADTGK